MKKQIYVGIAALALMMAPVTVRAAEDHEAMAKARQAAEKHTKAGTAHADKTAHEAKRKAEHEAHEAKRNADKAAHATKHEAHKAANELKHTLGQ